MTLSLCISLLLSMASSILFAESPLTLGIWLISMSLSISLFSSIMVSKWFAIILFLIYVGGLLVMFAYFSAISPNQLNDIRTMLLTSIISTSFMMTLLSTRYAFSMTESLWTMKPLGQISILAANNTIPLISAAIVLFFTMIIVIKMAPNHQGPLRPFSCY